MSLRSPLSNFNIKDVSIDVRLTAIVNNNEHDFTGKKLFDVQFFRENIGFGITNIDIEVNTSLQPIISITFKDLYGNTVLGKTKNYSPDLSNTDNDTDFSVLFNWPPPKYLFTFRGFLGKSATWMLNVKKTDVSYNSSDGSYTIKVDMVPNQWGFMSDLPFLFLLAVKALKKQTMNESEFSKVQTIFDLIKIGKQVEVKTKETTKEFDNIFRQMGLLKSQRVYDALFVSKLISYNDKITGQVGNQLISPNIFNTIIINKPVGPGNTDIDSPEKIKDLATNTSNLRRINTFFMLTAKIGNLDPLTITFNDVKIDGGSSGNIIVPSLSDLNGSLAARITLISQNISYIEDAVKLKTFNSSKNQLEKITIGEIFKQLAEDAGYIMGRILEAGYQGYFQNEDVRNSYSSNLIGRNFPLRLTDDKREEKPAIKQYKSIVGADEKEMAFVDNFISAIGEGIATELLAENGGSQGISDQVGDGFIKKRINNLEALRPNPYKSYFQSIAENIIVRSGIVGYLTRSYDPNKPGDYDTFFGGQRNSLEEILKIADAEVENINDNILGSLPDSEFKQLKTFCTFWDNLLTEDCLRLKKPKGGSENPGSLIEGDFISFHSSFPGQALPGFLMDYPVVIERPSDWDGTFQGQNGLQFTTLKNVIQDVFRKRPGQSSQLDTTNAHFIDLSSLQAKKIVNNGISYFKPVNSGNKYIYVMFSGPDAEKTQQVMSADSDSEIKNEAEKQKKDKEQPLGFVNIQTPLQKDGSFLPVVQAMNKDRIPNYFLLDYSKLINPNSPFFSFPNSITASDSVYFSVNNLLCDPDNVQDNQIPAKNIALSVVYHLGNSELVFGPFAANQGDDDLVQRAFIKRVCSKIKEKINNIEQKKNQIISDVLGKSGEHRDLIYKQMHVLYQQWEVLIVKDSYSALKQNSDSISSGGIAGELSERYSNHENFNMSDSIAQGAADNTFLYGYPLNSDGRLNIDVKKSIINIEPLYKPNGNTTVLNIIQQICTKNNFIFIPMPGDPGVFSTEEIFSPHPTDNPKIKSFFYVQFVPTPESRATISNSDRTPISSSSNLLNNLPQGTLEIKFGSPDNQIVKSVNISTEESKPTAESIINLQRLVDNENQNKVVTTDCSMLPVLEGRSYKASIEMLGNAQVFPMQFFYLNSNPLFNGLYQIMKVKHSITPNDMNTSAEGIRMRMDFQAGDFGGIHPITLDTLANIPIELVSIDGAAFTESDFKKSVADAGVNSTELKSQPDALPNASVTTLGVVLLPSIRDVRNSIRLTQSTNPDIVPITDTSKDYKKADIIKNLNEFIVDILDPFASFLKIKHPNLYKNWYITSAQRNYTPPGGTGSQGNKNLSQHQKGQAIDSQIIGGKNVQQTLQSNLELLNAIFEFYTLNPKLTYDQILWETRSPSSSWIHWSYTRIGGRMQLRRFINDTSKNVICNLNRPPFTNNYRGVVTGQDVLLKIA